MSQTKPNPRSRRSLGAPQRLLLALSIAPWLSACSGDVVNLGEKDAEPPGSSSCRHSAPLTGEVIVKNQEQLDELEGCPVVDGDLFVVAFDGADLRPLHALTTVEGRLWLGPDAFELNGDAIARNDELIDRGWLESLDGLESLELVGSLNISGFSGTSLEPLSNLRALSIGALMLDKCPNLQTLTGLENLRGLRELELFCDNLESMAALRLPTIMDALSIGGANVTDLGTLAVQVVQDDLRIDGTAFETLNAFSSLLYVTDTLAIENNPSLRDMSGLDGLGVVGTLIVRQNAALARLPERVGAARWAHGQRQREAHRAV